MKRKLWLAASMPESSRFPTRAARGQPFQPISFLLAHCDSFHLSSFRLSRGTFYFAQLGTSHFAATPQLFH